MSTLGGSKTRRARAHYGPMLPLPCARCGLPVYPDQAWHAGHQVDAALGGSDDLSNLWPEHQRCNLSAGGKLAAALGVGAHAGRRRRRPVVATVKRRSWS